MTAVRYTVRPSPGEAGRLREMKHVDPSHVVYTPPDYVIPKFSVRQTN